ncbi:MAG: TIGR00266 family protein [Oscillospiraceae bacterium]|nr:TIGR00266 family protein [Oscillospiraceae bacterium]MCR5806354.1 TIGR00266 family protein [Oscillospiraceae bacterium]
MQFEVRNAPLSVLVCGLAQGESVECQKGAMSWMTDTIEMQTNIGGAGGGGGLLGTLGKMAKSAVTGESIFRNNYTATRGPGEIAFASSFPGDIISFDLNGSNSIVAQKTAYLANTPGVNMELFFQKKVGAGFFGGEGFIMQKFTGVGTVFLEISGCICEYVLAPGQSMLVDTGFLAAMESTCSVDIETIKGVGNVLFGGEGLFNTRVTGPGKIWLQTMPASSLAASIIPYLPTSSS